jgi:hypothetical protein
MRKSFFGLSVEVEPLTDRHSSEGKPNLKNALNDLMKEERERLKTRSPGDRRQVRVLYAASTGVLLLGSWIVSAQLFVWLFGSRIIRLR